jgi:signal transduction histidine kinase
MINLFNISIKNKLVLMQGLISFVVLGLCFAAFVYTDIRGYKNRKVMATNTAARVVASNCASAIHFAYKQNAMKLLEDLGVQEDVVNAVIYDKNGHLFASYTRRGAAEYSFPQKYIYKPEFNFDNDYLEVYQPVMDGKEQSGVVAIRVVLTQLNDIIKEKLSIGSMLLLFGIAVSFLIITFNQRYVTKPLLYLVDVMQSIIGSADYKNRALVAGKDEIGQLSVAFNEMLSQIEKRDSELEARVKERTAELEAANKEMESFSYSVSHDMRAPLRAISGFARIVTKKYFAQLDDEGKDALTTINDEATRMGQLIDDLLSFSRLGKKEIQLSYIDMNSLAGIAITEVLNAEKKEIPPLVIIDKLPDAYGDSILLRQVIVNLFSNALKYSGKKPDPCIHIGSYKDEKQNVYFVEDNGVGFDMRYYNKLFGVFQRLHSAPEFSGTGIGLAIVHKVINRHGGAVWAEGQVGKGAKFYFSLPTNNIMRMQN